MVITGHTRKVIHLRELLWPESLVFSRFLRFYTSIVSDCFALNFALILSFVKFEVLTYKKLIFGEVSKRS